MIDNETCSVTHTLSISGHKNHPSHIIMLYDLSRDEFIAYIKMYKRMNKDENLTTILSKAKRYFLSKLSLKAKITLRS